MLWNLRKKGRGRGSAEIESEPDAVRELGILPPLSRDGRWLCTVLTYASKTSEECKSSHLQPWSWAGCPRSINRDLRAQEGSLHCLRRCSRSWQGQLKFPCEFSDCNCKGQIPPGTSEVPWHEKVIKEPQNPSYLLQTWKQPLKAFFKFFFYFFFPFLVFPFIWPQPNRSVISTAPMRDKWIYVTAFPRGNQIAAGCSHAF